jgi:hypothetical protein
VKVVEKLHTLWKICPTSGQKSMGFLQGFGGMSFYVPKGYSPDQQT